MLARPFELGGWYALTEVGVDVEQIEHRAARPSLVHATQR
jgi:hypothetical protein